MQNVYKIRSVGREEGEGRDGGAGEGGEEVGDKTSVHINDGVSV